MPMKVTAVKLVTAEERSEEISIQFSDGTYLSWSAVNIEILRNPWDGGLIVDGPRYEAWVKFRSQKTESPMSCCSIGKKVYCVCVACYSCPIHGRRQCHGSHD